MPAPTPGCPQITLRSSTTGGWCAAMEKGVAVKLEMDVKNSFYDDNPESFNVVGEIPGTDKANEIVMLGAHFDSWHGGTGATDNAAGSAVMMEAMRILKQSGVRLRRTVRIGLWGGEEQGLLGSRAYVTEHFANREDMVLKPEHARLSGYFNVDNGTGAIRGIYLQGNEAVAPIFEEWMKPFHNLGMTTVTIRDTGRNRSSIVRRRRPSRLPVHPGSGRVRHAHAPLQHGRLRAHPGAGHAAERRHRRRVRLPDREPRRQAAAQAAAEAAAARTGDGAVRRGLTDGHGDGHGRWDMDGRWAMGDGRWAMDKTF